MSKRDSLAGKYYCQRDYRSLEIVQVAFHVFDLLLILLQVLLKTIVLLCECLIVSRLRWHEYGR